MAYNQLNYLLKVKQTQEMIAELYEESAGFGTLSWMWRKLRKERRFFGCYRTFLNHASEPRLESRITELTKTDNQ